MKLTEKQNKRLKKQLSERKRELERQSRQNDHSGLTNSMRDSFGDLSFYDNHPADHGTELFERGKDIALNENRKHILEQVHLALDNMETGIYGLCIVCGQPIPYRRLEAIPWTAYCIQHVPDPDISYRRPAEEEFLSPPFGRTSFDERDDETQFDGEDAWQIVEGWGNSDSPAMAEDHESHDYDNLYIESDENEGYVEPIESFLATDLYGTARMIVRNKEYRKYMAGEEGDHGLEVIKYRKDTDL